jgi:hypothetical protein
LVPKSLPQSTSKGDGVAPSSVATNHASMSNAPVTRTTAF